MPLFGRKRGNPIKVTVNSRAFIEGRMTRAEIEAEAFEGDRVKDVLKRLARSGEVDSSVVRSVLRGDPGVTALRNGSRLSMPENATDDLADGDDISILTPMAGG